MEEWHPDIDDNACRVIQGGGGKTVEEGLWSFISLQHQLSVSSPHLSHTLAKCSRRSRWDVGVDLNCPYYGWRR